MFRDERPVLLGCLSELVAVDAELDPYASVAGGAAAWLLPGLPASVTSPACLRCGRPLRLVVQVRDGAAQRLGCRTARARLTPFLRASPRARR